MRKTISIILLFILAISITIYSYAAEEYTFDLQYTGEIEKNVTKDANVILAGKNATVYPKVRIKVEITGPSIPKILATDSTGKEHDIVQLGYWGPPEGFAVGGDFTNTTPVKATFTEAGAYKINLSLVNVENNSVITQKSFDLQVTQKPVAENNIVEELPKTGVSIWEYLLYFIMLSTALLVLGIYAKKKKYEN